MNLRLKNLIKIENLTDIFITIVISLYSGDYRSKFYGSPDKKSL